MFVPLFRFLVALLALALAPAAILAAPGDSAPADKSVSLAEFLQMELGAKFHPRSEWAVDGQFPVLPDPPRLWEPIGEIKYLTLHHAEDVPVGETLTMIQRIYRGHTPLDGRLGGAPDVGYHLFVDRQGEVWEGRDATKKGSHVKSTPNGLNNASNLGICVLDSYLEKEAPKPIVDAVGRLCELLCKREGRALQVTGHQDWRGINQKDNTKPLTWCPGNLEAAVPIVQKRIIKAFGPIPDSIRQIPVAKAPKFAPGKAKTQPKPKSAPKPKSKPAAKKKKANAAKYNSGSAS